MDLIYIKKLCIVAMVRKKMLLGFELSDIVNFMESTFAVLRLSRFLLSLRTSALSSFYQYIQSCMVNIV